MSKAGADLPANTDPCPPDIADSSSAPSPTRAPAIVSRQPRTPALLRLHLSRARAARSYGVPRRLARSFPFLPRPVPRIRIIQNGTDEAEPSASALEQLATFLERIPSRLARPPHQIEDELVPPSARRRESRKRRQCPPQRRDEAGAAQAVARVEVDAAPRLYSIRRSVTSVREPLDPVRSLVIVPARHDPA